MNPIRPTVSPSPASSASSSASRPGGPSVDCRGRKPTEIARALSLLASVSRSPRGATALRTPITILTLCLSFLLSNSTRADQPSTRHSVDPTTGRNLLNYPPHRWADIQHMRLQLRIPSMNDRTILASETLTIAPIATDLADFRLDAGLLQINSISAPNRTCTFTRTDPDSITIHLDPALPLGQTIDLTINYRVSDPPEGIIWTTESSDHPGRAAQLYAQGESDCNHYWFACHDAPNQRSTTELIITVPRGFQAIANGRLDSTKHESLEPFDTFHWIQDKPHPAYLVSLVVGKFDVVDVGSSRLPMPVYVAPGQAENARTTFARTPKMVALLERLTSRPYPWAKYAQVSAINFGWGGMENTSATTLFDGVAMDPNASLDGDEDDLLVHELAHQWFGDLVTCKSWEHIWLNEGFATYAEALWVQYQAAAGAGSALSTPSFKDGAVFHSPTNTLRPDQSAYDAMIWSWMSGLINDDHPAAPNQPAMVSKEYDTPGEVFDRKANPYGKGAIVLHMLRARLGDDIFFRGLAEYLNTHALSSVETVQFRQSMERASAQSLQRFFDQWCYRPGHPDLTVSSTFESGTLKVAFEQHQPIDGYNPAFDLRIPVWALTKSNNLDTWTRLEARFDIRTFTLEAALPAAPSMVLIDPELTTLADITLSTDTADLAAQLRSGPTPGSRLRAAAALGKAIDSPEIAATALAAVLHSDQAHRELRIACAKSLAQLASPGWTDNKHRSAEHAKSESAGIAAATDALRRALEAKFSDSRIRAAVLEQSAHALALADSGPRADLASRCSRIFAADRSYAVRAAAIRAIGTLGVAAEMPTVLKALDTNSHREQIRQAAIAALTDLDTPEAYAEVIKRTGPANPSFVRSAATTALGDLAHHDDARTISLLATLLDDREPRTADAAGNALAEIGGPKARALFECRAEASPSRSIRGQMKVWLQRFPPENKAQTEPNPSASPE